jgi:hypothetical protein
MKKLKILKGQRDDLENLLVKSLFEGNIDKSIQKILVKRASLKSFKKGCQDSTGAK